MVVIAKVVIIATKRQMIAIIARYSGKAPYNYQYSDIYIDYVFDYLTILDKLQ